MAVRQNVVREPKWMRAATVTPPPPLPPARKVKRFQFPYQHLADDFAKKNPDLVGTYIQTASYEFRTSTWCKALWEVAEAINRLSEKD